MISAFPVFLRRRHRQCPESAKGAAGYWRFNINWKRLRQFSFALMFIPSVLAAGPFDGLYIQAANSECGLVGVDGGALEIRDGIFYGVEVQCRMTEPVNVNNMDAILYTMQCSGEGQTWFERAMLMKPAQGDGLIMVWDGYAFVYDACTPIGEE
ncbi:hypothetical protein SAMN05444003_1911 [Cognatiyoonia sediminum]|uniref:Uncharacterized protein n=2 Tax=Cognatiyoonia sediminum TaxID=1508389 RepID=A0A1M5PY03_9RHOB|nr:hypothetical protein SAMN05444003_1911 [Cognatiyoonia sediminum]